MSTTASTIKKKLTVDDRKSFLLATIADRIFPVVFFIKKLRHMSQQSTFLYSPRTRIRSSRPDAWSVQDVIQAGRSVRPPSPGKASAPLCMRVDTSSYASACVVRPSRKSPIKGGTLASVSQSALDSRVVNNPGPS